MLSIYIFYCMLFAQPVKDNIKKILFFYPLFFHPYHRSKSKNGCLISDSHFTFFKKNSSYILTDNNSYTATKS